MLGHVETIVCEWLISGEVKKEEEVCSAMQKRVRTCRKRVQTCKKHVQTGKKCMYDLT